MACASFATPLTDTDVSGGFSVGVSGLPLSTCCADCLATSGCQAFVV